MRTLFVTIFLRFWLTVVGVCLALAASILLSFPRPAGPGAMKAAVATVFVFELPVITLLGGGIFCYRSREISPTISGCRDRRCRRRTSARV